MFDIVNYYERLVIDRIWQMQQTEAESFSQCFLEDVACLALNSLPTCYVCSPVDKSANLSETDHEKMRVAVEKAIAQAMVQVRLRPHEKRGG
ncbi:late competence development ComFB family protein [Methylomonas sp. MgM2]